MSFCFVFMSLLVLLLLLLLLSFFSLLLFCRMVCRYAIIVVVALQGEHHLLPGR